MVTAKLEQRMIEDMIHVQTSQADRKAIGKVRQFDSAEMESMILFVNTFQSDMGLPQALAELDEKEQAFLHLLALCNSEVAIPFFANLYPISIVPPLLRPTQIYLNVSAISLFDGGF